MNAKVLKAAVLGLSISVFASCSVLRGQQGAGDYASDTGITTEVKTKMAADKSVAATAINVETLNGTVQLSGFAKSQAEKEKAAEIARNAKGVRSVRNDIIVRP